MNPDVKGLDLSGKSMVGQDSLWAVPLLTVQGLCLVLLGPRTG